MRKAFTIIAITVLALATIQCKKKVETIKPAATGGVRITLDVDNDQKVVITPGESITTVTYESGDKMLVANGGHYVGYLTHDGTNFSGNIEPALSTDDKLHFFFLGNKVDPTSLSEGSSTSCVVDMSNQSTGPAVISYAATEENYDGSESLSLSVRLLNKASGLMKVTTTRGTADDISISNMSTGMTVSFAYNTFVPDDTPRTMKLWSYDGDEEHKTFLAVIPVQSAVTSTLTVEGFKPETIEIPAITENCNKKLEVSLTMQFVNAEFTVNSSGKKVMFSSGNLQYIGSAVSPYWKFANQQYDYIGSSQGTAEENVDRDLFGWGTSGWNNGNIYYQPFNTDKDDDKNKGYGYGPVIEKDGAHNYNNDLLGSCARSDWGVYNRYNGENKIENGGNHNWRTLQSSEWRYLIGPKHGDTPVPGDNCRESSEVSGTPNARFTLATINITDETSVNGMIIFPDNYTAGDTPDGVEWGTINDFINTNNYSTKCTLKGWSILETAGCVFLPAMGCRKGTDINDENVKGYYWSSIRPGSGQAYHLRFHKGSFDPSYAISRYYGYAVRLVFDTAK